MFPRARAANIAGLTIICVLLLCLVGGSLGSHTAQASPRILLTAPAAFTPSAAHPEIPLTGVFAHANDKPVTIRFLSYENAPFSPTERKLIAQFEQEYPNIHVKQERVTFDQLYAQTTVDFASGSPPDTVEVDGPQVWSYANAGILAPLTKWLTKEQYNDFVPTSIEEDSFKGQMYSLPQRQSAVAMFYNSDMTKAAGIVPPSTVKSAWSWSQALPIVRKLTKSGGNGQPPSVYGFDQWGPPGFMYQAYYFVRSNGNRQAAPNSSKYRTYLAIEPNRKTVSGYMDTPEAMQAYHFYQDLYQKYKVSQLGNPILPWENGKAATYISTDSEIANAQGYPKLHWGVTPQPYMATGFTHTGSTGYSVAAGSQHLQQAALFVVWMATGDRVYRAWQGMQQLPPTKSFYAKVKAYQQYPFNIFYDEMLQWGAPRPQSVAFREYEHLTSTTLLDIADGANVTQSVHSMVQQINQALTKYYH